MNTHCRNERSLMGRSLMNRPIGYRPIDIEINLLPSKF